MQWIKGPVALRWRLDHSEATAATVGSRGYSFVTIRKLLTRCGARMPLTPLNECSSAVMRSNAHNAPWRYQLVLPAKKGAQGMIVKHKLPYAIKKERDGAGDITLGLHPAARR